MNNYFTRTKCIVTAVLTLSLVLLCSCGGSGGASDAEEGGPSSQNNSGISSTSDVSSGKVQEGDSDEPSSQSPASESSGDLFPQTIVDNEQITFTITSSSMNDISGLTWDVYMENKTDTSLMFSMERVSINDVMCEPYWAEVVSPGKNSSTQINWMPDNLERLEIESATKVQFGLLVYDDEDYTASPIERQTYTVYPLGEESAASAVREVKDSDRVLLDNETCTVTFTSWDPDSDWGPALHLYITNKTDQDIMFSTQNVSLNDTMCDPYWASVISAGCSSDESLIWSEDTVAEKGIETISSITLPFTAYPEADVMQTLVDETLVVEVPAP